MTIRRLAALSTDDAYRVPWELRATDTPGIHRLTNLGRHTLDRVSVTVISGSDPGSRWHPVAAVALQAGEALEVRVPHAGGAHTAVVCWQRPDGTPYLWSAVCAV